MICWEDADQRGNIAYSKGADFTWKTMDWRGAAAETTAGSNVVFKEATSVAVFVGINGLFVVSATRGDAFC